MKIVACVVNWNSGDLIKKCLENLASQALGEIFVIDNASRDESPRIAEELGFKVIRNPKNAGYAAAANQAMQYAKSADADFIAIVNPDVTLSSNAIKLLAQALTEDPKAAVASPLAMSEKTGLVESAWYEFNYRHLIVTPHGTNDNPENYAGTINVPAIPGVAWMFKLSAFKQIGNLNEDFFLYHEDMEWCYRARLSGYHVLLVSKAQAHHAGFSNDPTRELVKSYFLGRNSVLFAKRWLKGYTKFKFWSFSAISVPIYLIEGLKDKKTLVTLKGMSDGIKGEISEEMKRFLDI